MIHTFFPEAFIQLQIEIGHHPLLIQRLQKHVNLGMEVIFAECCHYCGYAIDAELDGEQLVALADKLIHLLRNKSVQSAIVGLSDDWSKESWKFGVH
tara:strand:+ start:244 stop:534 length:291 start_codon:yes stop_codon:yes gene_type:complete